MAPLRRFSGLPLPIVRSEPWVRSKCVPSCLNDLHENNLNWHFYMFLYFLTMDDGDAGDDDDDDGDDGDDDDDDDEDDEDEDNEDEYYNYPQR